jgi:hypothetical protein
VGAAAEYGFAVGALTGTFVGALEMGAFVGIGVGAAQFTSAMSIAASRMQIYIYIDNSCMQELVYK